MNFSMTGQEKVIFEYRRLLHRGDHIGRFDCTLPPDFPAAHKRVQTS